MKSGSHFALIKKSSLVVGLPLLVFCGYGLYRFRPSSNTIASITVQHVSVRVIRFPHGRINDIEFLPDGKTLALAGPTVQVRDAKRLIVYRNYQSLKYPRFEIDDVRFSPNGQYLSFSGEICNIKTGRRQIPFQEGNSNHLGLIFSPDARTIAGGSKNALVLWHLGKNRPVAILGDAAALRERFRDEPVFPFLAAAAFSPDGRYITTGNTKGEVQLWDVKRRKLTRVLIKSGSLGASRGGIGVTQIVFSPDGHTVAASDAHQVILCDSRSGKEISRWHGPQDSSLFSLAFSPDGKILATGGPHFFFDRNKNWIPWKRVEFKPVPSKGEINLWEVPSGRLKSTLRDGNWIMKIAFSPDGQKLATSGDDNTVRLWDVPQ